MTPSKDSFLKFSLLGPNKEVLDEVKNTLDLIGRNSSILAKQETLDADREDFNEILFYVGPQWPKDIHCQSLFYVWLSTHPLPENYLNAPKCDYGITLESFLQNPRWHIQQVERIVQYKTHGNLSREWRNTVIEKLKTKSEILEQMNTRLKKLSITDDLTGVYNHRFFRQLFSDEMDRAHRYEFSLSLLMADIDHFKSVNDSFGHLVGDKVLISVSEELKKCVRRVDSVCRYGGEEFAIILPMTGLKPARELAERIRKQIHVLYPLKGLPVQKLSISIGVATYPEHGSNTESLLDAADKALYAAKAKGRNRVAIPGGLEAHE